MLNFLVQNPAKSACVCIWLDDDQIADNFGGIDTIDTIADHFEDEYGGPFQAVCWGS